jgi:hypothetical protein
MMFQGWRWRLREAEEALAQGRLHDVERLLREHGLAEYLPGRRLSDKLAIKLAERARTLLLQGESTAAWRELESAQAIGGDGDALQAVRREMTETVLQEAECCLATGDTAGVALLLDGLDRHGTCPDVARHLRDVAQRLDAARRLADRGKFAQAAEQVASIRRLRPVFEPLATIEEQYRTKDAQMGELTESLHRALSAEDWKEALPLADRMLAIAPDCQLAREVRRKAWAAVGARIIDSQRLGETHAWSRPAPASEEAAAKPGFAATSRRRQYDGSRFLLWVDAVGGYLVCLKSDAILGQAGPGSGVDIPILGDLSRKHVRLRRDGEAYVLEPIGPVRINGTAVHETTILRHGDQLELGTSVVLQFHKPHALSATARLDFVSRHRTQPSADAILLMAESCVLGPRKSNHVLCREWNQDVILYRQDEQLFCRAMESLEIDGQVVDGRGEVTRHSRIVGADFSLTLEPF